MSQINGINGNPSVDGEPSDDDVLVHAFGVKHGDCTLIEYRRAGVVAFRLLCDAGAGPALPAALVRHLDQHAHERGSKYIDLIALSHVDHDHQGGMPALFAMADVEVGEYWGPCLPAFRRLRWLFEPRVFRAVERAADLEKSIKARNVPILYPMEGHSMTACDRRVTISLVSPPPRLICQLLGGSNLSIGSLFTTSPLPLEWLISGTELGDEPDNGFAINNLLRGRTYLGPEDFPTEPPEVRVGSLEGLVAEAVDRRGAAIEPEFFGNSVLNDTSLVIAVDVLLDGKRRRRILLTGDQENWSYIASRYPAGLGVDVLKLPHHGGRVYLADKEEEQAIEQMYLWMRPRMAIVSAMGQHGLPHVRVREALRQAGTSLLCPNTRDFEPLSPGAVATDDKCCFKAYGCNARTGAQSEVVTLRLSAETESVNVPACLQGTIHRGPAPIVVQTQRLVEPDEAFVRWTRTEIEKQARWIQARLEDRHKEFLAALSTSREPHALVLKHEGIPWSELDTKARAAGHFHLTADPEPVLRFALARRFIVKHSPKSYSEEDKYYRPSTDKEIADDVIRWLRSVPNLLVSVAKLDMNWVNGGNRLALISAASLNCLRGLVAIRLRVPMQFVDSEVMPKIVDCLVKCFDARICNAEEPYSHLRDKRAALIHLHRKAQPVPDIFAQDWQESVWNSSLTVERAFEFMSMRARKDVCLASLDVKHLDKSIFGGFMPTRRTSWGEEGDYTEGHFLDMFQGAKWTELWQAQ